MRIVPNPRPFHEPIFTLNPQREAKRNERAPCPQGAALSGPAGEGMGLCLCHSILMGGNDGAIPSYTS